MSVQSRERSLVPPSEETVAEEELSPIERLREACLAEREQTEKELKEIEILVRQSSAEVEKLARRNAESSNRVRQMEADFGTVPRADIQTTYTTAQREQGRLFLMRGQAEKLQGNQESLQRYRDMLDTVIASLDQAGPGAVGLGQAQDEMSPAQSMIVRVIEAQESERRRLARQMHDGPAQLLTNLILQAEI